MAGPARVERLGRLLGIAFLAVAVDGSGNDAVRRRRGIALARRRVTFRGLGRYDILSVGHVDGATLVERPRAAVYLADEKSLAASK